MAPGLSSTAPGLLGLTTLPGSSVSFGAHIYKSKEIWNSVNEIPWNSSFWNSAELNANSDKSLKVRKLKIPAEFRTDVIPWTP